MLGDWSNPPNLAHTDNHTGNTEAECSDGSDTDRKLAWLVIIFWVISLGSATEEEMLGKANTAIDGEPISGIC